jgi:hypothetical protein
MLLDREILYRRLTEAVRRDDLSIGEATRLYDLHTRGANVADQFAARIDLFKARGIDLLSKTYDTPRDEPAKRRFKR